MVLTKAKNCNCLTDKILHLIWQLASSNIKLDAKKGVNREESAAFQRTCFILEPQGKRSFVAFPYISSVPLFDKKLGCNYRQMNVSLQEQNKCWSTKSWRFWCYKRWVSWQKAHCTKEGEVPVSSQPSSWSCGSTPSKAPPLTLELIQLTCSPESCLHFCWMSTFSWFMKGSSKHQYWCKASGRSMQW